MYFLLYFIFLTTLLPQIYHNSYTKTFRGTRNKSNNSHSQLFFFFRLSHHISIPDPEICLWGRLVGAQYIQFDLLTVYNLSS